MSNSCCERIWKPKWISSSLFSLAHVPTRCQRKTSATTTTASCASFCCDKISKSFRLHLIAAFRLQICSYVTTWAWPSTSPPSWTTLSTRIRLKWFIWTIRRKVFRIWTTTSEIKYLILKMSTSRMRRKLFLKNSLTTWMREKVKQRFHLCRNF